MSEVAENVEVKKPTVKKSKADNVNRFAILSQIDVSDKIKKKMGLNYLSWAWAWNELMKIYPDSYSTVYKDEKGNLYHTDGKTCWVETGVTLVDGDYTHETIEYLPVMNMSNKAVPLETINCMDVNKAIERSITKCIARQGLGIWIYAGEDLPEVPDDVKEAKAAEEAMLNELRGKVQKELARVSSGMSKEEKIKFANEYLVGIVGTAKYAECTDVAKMEKLYETIKNMAA